MKQMRGNLPLGRLAKTEIEQPVGITPLEAPVLEAYLGEV